MNHHSKPALSLTKVPNVREDLPLTPPNESLPYRLDLSFCLFVSSALSPKYGVTGEFVGFTQRDGSVLRPILAVEKQSPSKENDFSDLTADEMKTSGIEVIDMLDYALIGTPAKSTIRSRVSRGLLEAARCLTVMKRHRNGSVTIGPRGWELLQAAIAKTT